MTAQAAASAILTVTAAGGEVGPQRLVDALIGAGVALVFSQILFSPKPIALVRRAEASALARIADGLERAARALERCDSRSRCSPTPSSPSPAPPPQKRGPNSPRRADPGHRPRTAPTARPPHLARPP
ncbi:MAG: hypothetical protein ACM3ZF_03935 [Mycobacterium leprae]